MVSQYQKLQKIVEFAANNSPFYKELYKAINLNKFSLSALPIINQTDFWRANKVENNQLLTGEPKDGIVFKSGGTTGEPKFSFFSFSEWQNFTDTFGKGMLQNNLRSDERIANLFYAGSLYASFLFIHGSILNAKHGILFPLSGAAKMEEIVSTMEQFQIETLACVPTTIVKLIDHLRQHPNTKLNLKKLLFGGESFYPDQRAMVHSLFPECQIMSIGYASVDGGEIGYADQTCGIDEHRVFDETTILEIIDEETGMPINEPGKIGKILITNLDRTLMPIIRYPVGDMGMWVEKEGTPNRKYRLAGRTEEGARIGPVTLYLSDVSAILSSYYQKLEITSFQIVVDHNNFKDQATIRIASTKSSKELQTYSNELINLIYSERKFYKEQMQEGIVAPLQIEWITTDQLYTNDRTGKLKRIIDRRFNL